MYDFSTVKANLERRGFAVSCFATAEEAAAYLDGKLDGKTIGIGGSVTIREMGLDQRWRSTTRYCGTGSTAPSRTPPPPRFTSPR